MPDDRPRARAGQPLAIAGLFITIAFGVLLWLMFNEVIPPVLDTAATYGDSQTASTGTSYMRQAYDAVLYVFVGIGVFGLITIAVFRRQRV